MSVWIKNQSWNSVDTPRDQVTSEVEWNLWQNRISPFAELDIGDTVFLAYGGHGKNSYVTWETEVTHVLRTRYRSFADAARSINGTFGDQIDNPRTFHQLDYCVGKPASGWLLAFSYEPVRQLVPPVQRGDDLEVRQNGWADLSNLSAKDLRRLGLVGGVIVGGKNPGAKDQGLLSDQEARRLVEDHAMSAARTFLIREGFTKDQIIDTSANRPYDFECQRGDKAVLRVEVKGTRGTGSVIRVTRGEVDHALTDDVPTALLVVSGIELLIGEDTTPLANGGVTNWYFPWRPAATRLIAETYTYRVE